MTWASGHLLWNAEDLGCRVGFWGGPRADDRLTRWRHRQGMTMPRYPTWKMPLLPSLVNRNASAECERMWWAHPSMDVETILGRLLTLHPVTKDTTP
jgi:hypothetical protein